MKAKLIVVGGTASINEVDLKLPTIIGRGRSADITIPHSLVSRQHCEISERDGYLVAKDLDSLNGTYVGDERISEIVLQPEALLTVGTVTFRAMYDVSPGESQRQSSDKVFEGPQEVGPLLSFDRATPDAETVPVEQGIVLDSGDRQRTHRPKKSAADRSVDPDTANLISVAEDAALESAPPKSS